MDQDPRSFSAENMQLPPAIEEIDFFTTLRFLWNYKGLVLTVMAIVVVVGWCSILRIQFFLEETPEQEFQTLVSFQNPEDRKVFEENIDSINYFLQSNSGKSAVADSLKNAFEVDASKKDDENPSLWTNGLATHMSTAGFYFRIDSVAPAGWAENRAMLYMNEVKNRFIVQYNIYIANHVMNQNHLREQHEASLSGLKKAIISSFYAESSLQPEAKNALLAEALRTSNSDNWAAALRLLIDFLPDASPQKKKFESAIKDTEVTRSNLKQAPFLTRASIVPLLGKVEYVNRFDPLSEKQRNLVFYKHPILIAAIFVVVGFLMGSFVAISTKYVSDGLQTFRNISQDKTV